ncbi:hypothetical protein [Streptomyces sp. enrichment culture]|uniref:hypothetical protein n=1 Tax=Streptomyces sp. enrichment culture TaxID=1795815 RepID=UPI003F557C4D
MTIEVTYDVRVGGEFTKPHIEQLARAAGRSSLSDGEAMGYVSDTSGVLFVPCPGYGDRNSLARIEAVYLHHPDDVQRAWREHFRDLTVSAARHVAQDILKCKNPETLGDPGNT